MGEKPIRPRGKEPAKGKPDLRNLYANCSYLGVYIGDCLGTTDERLAKRRLEELKLQVERGEYQAGRRTFEKAVAEYRNAILSERSKSVQERHDVVIRKHLNPVFKGKRIAEISPNDVYQFFRKHSKDPESSLKKKLRVLKEILQMGNRQFSFPEFKFENKGKRFDESQILEEADVLELIKSVHYPYRVLCLIAAYTGLRLKNIVELEKRNVDLKEGWINVRQSKTGRPVSIPICGKLMDVLRAIKVWPLNPTDRFFPRINAKAVSIAVTRAMTRAGYSWASFHSLRHSAACTLINNGVPLELIMKFMGHTDLRSTLVYARLKKEKVRDAVKVFDQGRG